VSFINSKTLHMLVRASLLLALVISLPACSGGPTTAPAPPVDTGDALKELGEVYKYIATQKAPLPRKVEDLAEYSGTLEGAMPKIQSGEIIVVWGSSYSTGSGQVLAYEKEAAASGGKVLLRNGTVKDMTAAEFAAAPKAK
jgi:hypothetical protein